MSRMFARPEYDRTTTDALGRKGMLALISRLAPGIATLLVNVAIGRLGGTALLGLTQTVTSGASIAALVYPAGGAASRYLSSLGAQGERETAQAVAAHLSRRVLLASTAAALVVSASVLLGNHGSGSVALLSGLMVIAVAGRAFVEGLHFGGGEGARLAKWSLTIAILSSTATVVLLLIGVRDVWVMAPLIALPLAFVVFSWPRRASRRLTGGLAKEIRGFVALSVVGTLASTGFGQAAVLVGGASQGLSFVGQYSAAMTMTTPLGVIAAALAAVLFPALAATHSVGTAEAVKLRLGAVTSIVITVMVGLFIPLAVLSELLVSLIWGSKFPQTAWIILFVLPAIVVSTIAVPAVSTVTASSNRGMATSAVSSVIGAVTGVVVWVVLIPSGSPVAIPLGFAAGTVVIAAIPLVIAWRRYRMAWAGEMILVVVVLAGTLALAVLGQQWELSPVYSVLGAAVLTGLWLLVRHRSVRILLSRLRRRA